MVVFLLSKIFTQLPELLLVGGKYPHCFKRISHPLQDLVRGGHMRVTTIIFSTLEPRRVSGRPERVSYKDLLGIERVLFPGRSEFPFSMLPAVHLREAQAGRRLEWNPKSSGDSCVNLLEFGDVPQRGEWLELPWGWGWDSVWREASQCMTVSCWPGGLPGGQLCVILKDPTLVEELPTTPSWRTPAERGWGTCRGRG